MVILFFIDKNVEESYMKSIINLISFTKMYLVNLLKSLYSCIYNWSTR